MSTLAPDEKVCPFCAETIKAAAVKCRFCQSDLPTEAVVEPVPDPATAPAVAEGEDRVGQGPEDAAHEAGDDLGDDLGDDPRDEDEDDDDGTLLEAPEPEPVAPVDRRRGLAVVAALVVLCLVLSGTLWFLVHRSLHPHLGTAPDGQVTDTSFRNAAMSAASDAATQALSYSWQSFDQDRKKARALMSPKLARQYDETMDKVAQQTAASKLTLKATVLSAGLLSAEEHKARVLLFLNTLTTREGSKKQQLDQNRVLMDLVRKDGDWIVSDMRAF